MEKKHMKASLNDFVKFLMPHCQVGQPSRKDDSASVLDDADEEYVVDFGSGPLLETSPTSSLIRSWQSLCGEED